MLADVNLLYTNSVQYNGESHAITAIASKIVQTCKEQFDEHAEQFDALEKNIERQNLTMPSHDDLDDWQQAVSTDQLSSFTFQSLTESK